LRNLALILCVILGMGFTASPVRADVVTINFDTVMTHVWQCQLWPVVLTLNPPVLPATFTLDPAVCDINGGFDISQTPIALFPNDMLDSDEFSLVAAILANPSFDCTATGGTSHTQVHDAWTRDFALAWRDLGGGPNGETSTMIRNIDDVEYFFTGMMVIGDQDTLAFPLLIMDLVINNSMANSLLGSPGMAIPNPDEYTLLYPYLGWCGDADGDGCSNLHEYEAAGGNRAQYLAAALNPAVHPAGCTDDRMCDGTGGLLGEYFGTRNLSDLKATRVDHQVTFDWGGGIPHPALGVNDFSVCWSGTVTPQYSDVYDFLVRTDDGVLLWVNGELLVNEWNDHGSTTYTGTTSTPLVAGQAYDIRMVFYEKGGDAVAWLGWESANQPRKGIYEMYLTPGTGIGDRSNDWIRNPANGHYYKITPSMTWTDGNTLAGQWGGYLSTINDAAENLWIRTTMGPLADVLYIGANDIQTEGRWVWAENGANFYNGDYSNGTTVAPWYSNWSVSEPNNASGIEHAGMTYAGSGTWNDLPVAYTRNCLVETDTGRLNITGPTPANATIHEGGAITMQVNVRHPYGTVQYQWRRDGDDIAGATQPTYSIPNVLFAHAGRYTCFISDDSPAVQESNGMLLAVAPKVQMPAASTAALAGLALALAALGARRRRA
jgi:hypothetical protein